MKKYIFITDIADAVTGGLIYPRNKMLYLEERGWRVYVLPTNCGKIYIKDFERFSHLYFPFIRRNPNEYVGFQRKKLVEQLAAQIEYQDGDEIIVESGTDYSAYWGELLAERLHARNMVFFQDEFNDGINPLVAPFFAFKFRRNELVCISKQAMQTIFGPYIPAITVETAVGTRCYCSNSVEDFDHPFTAQIEKGDFTIGYMGRLDKRCMPLIQQALLDFAAAHPNKKVSFVAFGGSTPWIEADVRQFFENKGNLKAFISGIIFPNPKAAVLMCDMYISTAQSAFVPAKFGIPSIKINEIDDSIEGLVTESEKYLSVPIEGCETLLDYLNYILVEKRTLPEIKQTSIEDVWNSVCRCFDIHFEYIGKASKDKMYATSNMFLIPWKKRVVCQFKHFIGEERYLKFKRMITRH